MQGFGKHRPSTSQILAGFLMFLACQPVFELPVWCLFCLQRNAELEVFRSKIHPVSMLEVNLEISADGKVATHST